MPTTQSTPVRRRNRAIARCYGRPSAAERAGAEPDAGPGPSVAALRCRPAMDSRSIVVLRLRNLRLIGAPFATPTEAIRTLGAVQSQDHGPAKWSVAMRTRAVSDAAM